MRRVTAIEVSSVLVAAGALMAFTLDARAGGVRADVVGWIVMGLGLWSLALFVLVGTTATTAIGTTHSKRENRSLAAVRRTKREEMRV